MLFLDIMPETIFKQVCLFVNFLILQALDCFNFIYFKHQNFYGYFLGKTSDTIFSYANTQAQAHHYLIILKIKFPLILYLKFHHYTVRKGNIIIFLLD